MRRDQRRRPRHRLLAEAVLSLRGLWRGHMAPSDDYDLFAVAILRDKAKTTKLKAFLESYKLPGSVSGGTKSGRRHLQAFWFETDEHDDPIEPHILEVLRQ